MTIDDFINKMIFFFPGMRGKISEHISVYGEQLNTVVVEDIIMPEIIRLLNKELEDEKLKAIFSYFEEVSVGADKNLHDVFMITALEVLGNDDQLLEKARQYMGPMTRKLQMEADAVLGRQV